MLAIKLKTAIAWPWYTLIGASAACLVAWLLNGFQNGKTKTN